MMIGGELMKRMFIHTILSFFTNVELEENLSLRKSMKK
jgi:hypothetical protein